MVKWNICDRYILLKHRAMASPLTIALAYDEAIIGEMQGVNKNCSWQIRKLKVRASNPGNPENLF